MEEISKYFHERVELSKVSRRAFRIIVDIIADDWKY